MVLRYRAVGLVDYYAMGMMMDEIIDDKWAAVWPRRWVMVRDDGSDPWKGPYRLLGRATYCPWEYVTDRGPFGQCRPATPEEIATVEPSEPRTEEPRSSDEAARYLELKRLAEMAWVAILPEECAADAAPSNVADAAWAYAEFMLIESERRRPKQ